MEQLASRDLWVWVWLERASWVIAALGIPALIYQFKTIADELTKRPRLEFGLVPTGAAEAERLRPALELSPSWPPDAEWSDEMQVEFRACNRGQRTARDLVFNVSLPPPDPASQHQVSSANLRRRQDGSVTMINIAEHLHPGATQVIQVPMRVRRSAPALSVEVKIAMADATEKAFHLLLRFDSTAGSG